MRFFSGLKVTQEKSNILLLDDTRAAADPGSQLQWVNKFTYLGVCISARVADYFSLNLQPLLDLLKRKIEIWKNLPLSVMG